MKKTIINICFIASLIGVVVCAIWFGYDIYHKDLIYIDKWDCEVIFDCSFDEFFEKEHEIYSQIGDLRKNARIKDNFLVLRVNSKQRAIWREYEYEILFDVVDNNPYVELSPNLTSLTIDDVRYENTLLELRSYDEFVDVANEFYKQLNEMIIRSEFIKLLDRVPQDFITIDNIAIRNDGVHYKEMDYKHRHTYIDIDDNGEVIYIDPYESCS